MKVIEVRRMKTVKEFILELSNFPVDRKVRFFTFRKGLEVELIVADYDQDENGNPTFLLEIGKNA